MECCSVLVSQPEGSEVARYVFVARAGLFLESTIWGEMHLAGICKAAEPPDLYTLLSADIPERPYIKLTSPAL